MDDLLLDAFQRMLDTHCTARHVRDMEAGGRATDLWAEIEASGFADAMLSESEGGAGLSAAVAFPILLACGASCLPVPLAHTLVLRPRLGRASPAASAGSITLACDARTDGATLRCTSVPCGLVADRVVVTSGGRAYLLDAAAGERRATGVWGSLQADFAWPLAAAEPIVLDPMPDWRAIGATVTAALLAGAMERIQRITLDYVNERIQFGKAIGRFQAIQQQLSVLAEEAAASRMAAQMGCVGLATEAAPVLAGIAKSRTSGAAAIVASIAHAAHGAIGITEEYDLQLHTRRLQEWRLDYGSESYWNRAIGRAYLAGPRGNVLDFMLDDVFVWEGDGARGLPDSPATPAPAGR